MRKIFLWNEKVLTFTNAPGASYTYRQGNVIELWAAEGGTLKSIKREDGANGR